MTAAGAGRHKVELVATVRVAMLSIGCAVFLGTALWIATSPVSVSV